MQAHTSIVAFTVISIFLPIRGNLQDAKEYSQNPKLYTSFYLYSSLRFKDSEVLPLYNDKVLKVSRFNRRLPTRILIHSYNGSKDDEFNRYMMAAYLLHQNLNVIVVDWSKAVSLATKDFQLGVRNARLAGQVIANFVDFLHDTLKYPTRNVYMIGFGLGAHVAGYAGRAVQNKPVGVIFALDPSESTFVKGPSILLSLKNATNRLSATDAEYVEVLHTNYITHGTLQALGHADFYANGGTSQPGCTLRTALCSHQRAYKIMAESVNNPTGFHAKRCQTVRKATLGRQCKMDDEDYFFGGEPAYLYREGIFSFRTSMDDPYSKI